MKKWFLLIAISTLFILSQDNGWAGDFENTPKLMVKGEASIFKPADQMEVDLGVRTVAKNASQGVAENNQQIKQVIANIKALGLDESEYQTGRFRIQPIYQNLSEHSEDKHHPILSHYEVINTIHIKTQKLELAEKLLEKAIEGGANQVDQVNFNLHSPESYREEAIQLAMQNAIINANALVKAAKVRLGRVLLLSLDQWHNFPAPLMLAKMAVNHSINEVPLEAGQVEIHASVNVTLEILTEG